MSAKRRRLKIHCPRPAAAVLPPLALRRGLAAAAIAASELRLAQARLAAAGRIVRRQALLHTVAVQRQAEQTAATRIACRRLQIAYVAAMTALRDAYLRDPPAAE